MSTGRRSRTPRSASTSSITRSPATSCSTRSAAPAALPWPRLLEGRKAIAIDRSPAATFITKNYCTPVDPDALRKAFDRVRREVQPEIDWLYETRCDRCGGKATTGYTVYSQVFQCPRCLEKIALYDCGDDEAETAAGKPKAVRVCPTCQARGFTEVIHSQGEKFGYIPVKVVYHCEKRMQADPRRAEAQGRLGEKRYNFREIRPGEDQEIESRTIPHWFPDKI